MPTGHYLISEDSIVEKHRKARPMSKQMFLALFSKLAVIYTETILYTWSTNVTAILRFAQHSMGKIDARTGTRAVSECCYVGP